MTVTVFGVKFYMTILITNALRETIVVGAVLLLALVISARRTKDNSFFPLQTTSELKGLAILMVVFSHIGYFLVSDRNFLVPLSNYAGVGVDLFLILSGYGLVASALQRPLSAGKFYLKRVPRIYFPVVTTVLFFLAMDFFFLRRSYPLKSIMENLLGFFRQADLYNDINSPLWYITLLLVTYLLFPLVFRRRFPAVSALAMAVIGWFTVKYIPQLNIFSEGVLKLYKLHFLAFPMGMVMASLINQPPKFFAQTAGRWRAVLAVLAVAILVFTYYHSYIGVDWKKEVAASLSIAIAIIALFLIKKINFKILILFGLYSFEIYLIHWPLLYRYNFLYGKISAGAATIIYLALFLGIGYLFHKAVNKIFPPTKVCTVLQD